jgi:hypothetical protein
MGVAVPAFIVPGHDAAHATSAARYLEECLPQSNYWDAAIEAQIEAAFFAWRADLTSRCVVVVKRPIFLPLLGRGDNAIFGFVRVRPERRPGHHRRGLDRRVSADRAMRYRSSAGVRPRFVGRAGE